jgi:tetratricopeptide (TPR) repeat protein
MAKRLAGPTSPEVAERLNTLGTIVHAAGRLDDAERMFVEATQIFRDTLGPGHLRVSVGLANTSLVRRQRGDLDGAERLAHEALAISRRVLGQAWAEGLGLVASVRIEQRRLAEAETLLREALDYCRRGFGRNPHPVLVHTLTELAKVLEARGNTAEAVTLRAEAASLDALLKQ